MRHLADRDILKLLLYCDSGSCLNLVSEKKARKEGKKDNTNPETIKEAGNKAFLAKNYEEAVKQYTMAIEITLETPNHIYFANRANAHLEL